MNRERALKVSNLLTEIEDGKMFLDEFDSMVKSLIDDSVILTKELVNDLRERIIGYIKSKEKELEDF